MLFDEKELNVFDNDESKTYFKEILQSYYNQNYRATIVLLYSFVIYDLFMKLQTMANEGDKKANAKLTEINTMIADDKKYSMVESNIIEFFKENCPLYFNRFVEDIEYLRNCRNKCAHLKVDDNSLYIPSDYHVRMLICSMYDNILSVKAPFIMDLFTFATPDIERYSSQILHIPSCGLDESIKNEITNKYLKRLTYNSIKKSYKTFLKLLFISTEKESEANINGLYAFTYALTDYIIKNGYTQIYSESEIQSTFDKIQIDAIKSNIARMNALTSIMVHFPTIMDLIRNCCQPVFEHVSTCVLLHPTGLRMYRVFYPRAEKSIYLFFLENSRLHNASFTETLYETLNNCEDFNINEFMKLMVRRISTYNAFSEADTFTSSFIKHIKEINSNTVEEIIKIYMRNNQCTNRARHASDMAEINKYLADSSDSTALA